VALGQAVVRREGGSLTVRAGSSLEDAVTDASFVLNSIRVSGGAARAHDERVAIHNGYPGQETTGPAGAAMALRTVPVAVEQAQQVHRFAPQAWLINFTNPAGLITQAITQYTYAKVVGICDTPTEMLHRIAKALMARPAEVRCYYLGLNHLGWIRKIELRGENITARLLEDDVFLAKLYPVPLFDHDLIRCLGLIPTEYLFFYYSRRRALANQINQGSTRGEEIEGLNEDLFRRLRVLVAENDEKGALRAYIHYLNVRSGSYMALEGAGGTAFHGFEGADEDPFSAATGYHRIALDVMKALCGDEDQSIIVNTRNAGAIDDIDESDVVEVPCIIGNGTIVPRHCGSLPDDIRGLVLAVKEYERATIEAAMTGSMVMARKAMLLNPVIGEWEPSAPLLRELKTEM
jgi:6-phospho-beta-glucosidase